MTKSIEGAKVPKINISLYVTVTLKKTIDKYVTLGFFPNRSDAIRGLLLVGIENFESKIVPKLVPPVDLEYDKDDEIEFDDLLDGINNKRTEIGDKDISYL